MSKQNATGWIVGYFVAFYPIHLAMNFTFVGGLIHGILGLIGAIVFVEVIN